MKKYLITAGVVVSCLVIVLAFDAREGTASYQTHLSPAGALTITRRPPPTTYERGSISSLPAYDPNAAKNSFQVDLRSGDLSQVDIEHRLSDLLHADFDSRTRWPAKLPAGFVPAQLMELGKNPGLGLRQLHAKGVTGKGVGIGIIDQTLLVDHTEYADQLRLYEEIHNLGIDAQMHGPAVASIAVGKTVGVAPEADLYYLAETHGTVGALGHFDWDFQWVAKSIDRLLEVNTALPKERKIRVISISVGWSPKQKGYQETMRAVRRATDQGVFVISTALQQTHGLAFHGLGRAPASDPDAPGSYGPGLWWADHFWAASGNFTPGKMLLVPMDSRCMASPTGNRDYVYYSEGGWSWCVPWIAGLYTLACQVDPGITPEKFWQTALQTGQTVRLQNDGKAVPFGTIADPVALIETLQQPRVD